MTTPELMVAALLLLWASQRQLPPSLWTDVFPTRSQLGESTLKLPGLWPNPSISASQPGARRATGTGETLSITARRVDLSL